MRRKELLEFEPLRERIRQRAELSQLGLARLAGESQVARTPPEGADLGEDVVSDDPRDLEAELRLLAGELQYLRESIALLQGSDQLKPDAAARLAIYRRREERLVGETRSLHERLRQHREHLEPRRVLAGFSS